MQMIWGWIGSHDNVLSCFWTVESLQQLQCIHGRFWKSHESRERIWNSCRAAHFHWGITAISTPNLRESQERISRYLKISNYALLVYNPFLRNDFRYAYQAQFDEFIRIFGKPPSHVDGHQHMHLASNMIFDCIVQRGSKIRRNYYFYSKKKYWIVPAAGGDCRLKRYRITDYFFALSQNLTINRLTGWSPGKRIMRELMAHPEVLDDLISMSDQYWLNFR
jgi:hypothetical protein